MMPRALALMKLQPYCPNCHSALVYQMAGISIGPMIVECDVCFQECSATFWARQKDDE